MTATQTQQRASEAVNTRKGVFPLALLAFPLFLSVDLDRLSPALDAVVNAWKLLSLAVCIFLYLNRMLGRKPIAGHIVTIGSLLVALLLSTWANDGDYGQFFIVWGGFFAVALLVDSTIRERPLQLLLALKIVLGVIVLLNFAAVILRPDGLWMSETQGFWLLGHRNNFGSAMVAAIAVSAAHDLLSRRRLTLTTIGVAAASLASVLLTWSASSIVAVVLTIGAMLLVSFSRKGLKALNPYVLLGGYIFVDVGIVAFRVQEWFSDFIENVLDRSTSLTGRTRIWEIVFGMIQDSPFIGNGVQLAKNNGLTIYDPNFVHAHNAELDILMTGGILAFIPYAAMILLTTRRAHLFYDNRLVQVLYIALIINMIRGITGLFFSSYAVLIVFLLLNSDAIVRAVGGRGDLPAAASFVTPAPGTSVARPRRASLGTAYRLRSPSAR